MIRPSILLRPTLIGTPLTKQKIFSKRYFSTDLFIPLLDAGTTTLQVLHSTSGLPWWAFIPIVTFSFRSIFTLPLAIYQRRGIQKQNELIPITNAMKPILSLKLASNAQTEQLKRSSNPSSLPPIKSQTENLTADKITLIATKETMKRRKELFRLYGCQRWKLALLPAIQIPLWVFLSFNFRSLTGWSTLAHRPIDMSLTTEGFSYLTDLTVCDPYYILPITLGLIALTNTEWNFKSADLMYLTSRGIKNATRPTFFDSIMNVSRGSIVFLMVMATQAPSALVLYWISSNSFSLCQNLLLDKYLPMKYTPYSRFSNSSAKVSKDATPLVKY